MRPLKREERNKMCEIKLKKILNKILKLFFQKKGRVSSVLLLALVRPSTPCLDAKNVETESFECPTIKMKSKNNIET